MMSLQGVAVALVIGVAVGSMGAWAVRGQQADLDMAKLASTFATAVETAKDDARAEERKLQVQANKIAEEARKDVQTINESAAVVDAVTGGLQHDAAVYASQVCDPGVARRGAAATRSAMVLSDLFGQCVETAARVAKEADLARAAGTACERVADSFRQSLDQ